MAQDSVPVEQPGETSAARAERLRRRSDSDFVDVMSSAHGQRFVWELLERAGVFTLSYAAEQTHITAFNEGRRNEGLRLLARIDELCPSRYQEMRLAAKEGTGA